MLVRPLDVSAARQVPITDVAHELRHVRYGPKALRRPAVGKGLQLRAFVKFHCASAGALASDLILVIGRAGAVALIANLRCHDGCPGAGHSASQPQRDLISSVTVVLGVKQALVVPEAVTIVVVNAPSHDSAKGARGL